MVADAELRLLAVVAVAIGVDCEHLPGCRVARSALFDGSFHTLIGSRHKRTPDTADGECSPKDDAQGFFGAAERLDDRRYRLVGRPSYSFTSAKLFDHLEEILAAVDVLSFKDTGARVVLCLAE